MDFEFSQKDCLNLLEERNMLLHENTILRKKIEKLEKKNCSDLKNLIKKMEKRIQNCLKTYSSEAKISDYQKMSQEEREIFNKAVVLLAQENDRLLLENESLKNELSKLEEELKDLQNKKLKIVNKEDFIEVILNDLVEFNKGNYQEVIDMLFELLKKIFESTGEKNGTGEKN